MIKMKINSSKMKNILLAFSTLLIIHTSFAQNVFPIFLQGTWKMKDAEVYEHWDKLNDYAMKGITYVIESGQITFFEYLDLFYKNDTINYVATVVGQNKGQSIAFAMTQSDTIFSFENPQHDFPKIITYQKISDDELIVKISDGKTKEITYSMKKENQNNTPINSQIMMKKVTGIGGIFFKCKDPNKMREWYNTNLGLKTNEYGAVFEWYQGCDNSKKGFTTWSPFEKETTYFEPSENNFMINYRVENLEELVEELRKSGVTIVDTIERFEYGKFVHILDIEGNKIELWEPNDIEYEKLGNQLGSETTK
jgi:predicted enzyme related to lactoylglutathione lyase